jgi:hypothetical protein
MRVVSVAVSRPSVLDTAWPSDSVPHSELFGVCLVQEAYQNHTSRQIMQASFVDCPFFIIIKQKESHTCNTTDPPIQIPEHITPTHTHTPTDNHTDTQPPYTHSTLIPQTFVKIKRSATHNPLNLP